MNFVECPCCHGTTQLVAVDTDQPSGEVVLKCLHCDDGKVRADELVKPVVENVFDIVIPESLKRNTMTVSEKREHLRGLGMKDPADIEKTLKDIYADD